MLTWSIRIKNFFLRKNNFIILLHAVLIGVTLYYFWTQSRYPALGNKMFMGTRNSLTGISFDNIWPVANGANILKKILAGTVNWYFTNWKGMTFGFILSGLMLSLASFLKFPTTSKRWLRPLYGAFIGAPLGVCANCATPITQGYKASGGNNETAIAITLSSPTLNIIVLSILFQNFPQKLIGLKLGVTFLMIFIVVPILHALLGKKEEIPTCDITPPLTSQATLKNFLHSILKSYAYIAKTTLPLMLLAGLIGSAIFETLDLNYFFAQNFSWSKLILISGIGTFLPVPMTFDLIFAMKMIENQSNISFITALLCTLGIFSVYPLMMFWKSFSRKVALGIFFSVWGLGIAAGAAIHFSDQQVFNDFPIEKYKLDTDAYIKNSTNKVCDKNIPCYKRMMNEQARITNRAELCTDEECEMQLKVLALNLDYEKCNNFPDKDKCLKQMLLLADNYSFYKALPCELKGKQNDPTCEDLIALAASTFLPKLGKCEVIKNPFAKDSCLILSATIMAKNRSETQSRTPYAKYCSMVENEKRRDMCFLKLAAILSDNSWCQHIENANVKNNTACIVQASLNNCQELNNQSLVNQCKQLEREKNTSLELKLFFYMSSLGKPFHLKDFTPQKFDFDNLQFKIKNNFQHYFSQNNIEIKSIPFRKRQAATLPFTLLKGETLGLTLPKYSVYDIQNFIRGYGAAAGDINNDHLQDFITGSFQDLNIFINTGGEFTKIPVLFKEKLKKEFNIDLSPTNLALVDINNDGYQDMFIANYDGNVFFVINDKKYFSNPDFIILPKGNRKQAAAATFGDFDHNGLLDVYLGNAPGTIAQNVFYVDTTNEVNRNQLYLNINGHFIEQPLYDNYGVTISTLATDMNNDGFLDLISGNDFKVSDLFFFGDSKGHLREILPKEKIIPATTNNTMSFDTADIDNDLKLETFAIGMSKGVFISTNYCSQFKSEEKEKCNNEFNISNSLINLEIKVCESVLEERDRINCYTKALETIAKRFHDPKICSYIPNEEFVAKNFCYENFETRKTIPIGPEHEHEQLYRNVLLKQLPDGHFEDITEKYGVTNSHWGWNSKFADLDNDGWQDIYAANGRFKFAEIATNIFFHNQKGKRFSDDTKLFNLTDYVDTSSYVYIDYDFDGDIDIISQGYVSPLRVFQNNEAKNSSISFELSDKAGNRFGIGAKIIISYFEDGQLKKQLKELKSGGGFASFDPSVLYFGLGKATQIDSVEIRWPTGKPSVIHKSFPANHYYIIERKDNGS